MRLNQSGFSLVQVMVALAVTVASSMYLLIQQQTSAKLQSKTSINYFLDSVSSLPKSALSSSAVCKASIGGGQFGPGDEIPNLKNADGTIIMAKDDNYPGLGGGITVVSMRIVTESVPDLLGPPGAKKDEDFLAIVYDINPRKRFQIFGGETVGKKFRLKGSKIAGKYDVCWSDESNLVEMGMVAACTQLNGLWSDITKKCTMNTGDLIDQTPVYCAPPLKYYFAVIAGKIKIQCIN
jgi:hypothetical protein